MTTAILMKVEDVAKELDVTPVEAQRLIARRRLAATRMGADGAWRVLPDALAEYVGSGAADLRLAEYDQLSASGWYDTSLAHAASWLERSLLEAAEEQVPSDEELVRDFVALANNQGTKWQRSIDSPLRDVGAVAEVIRRAVPVSQYGTATVGQAQTRFASWGELYGVDAIRTAARQLVTDADMMAAPLAYLYDSPERYADLSSRAYDLAAQRRIVFSRVVAMPAGFEVQPEARRASFLFPVSAILTPAAKQRLLTLTF